MKQILLLGKGISNNALNQFMIKYSIEHDFFDIGSLENYDYQLVIKGPGIFYENPVIKKFIELGVPIITDIEFIYWFLNKEYIAVTGTNGKTTTTYLIRDIINAKFDAVACGNCGYPIAQAALDYKQYKYFVLELSSFELKGTKKFAPKIAVVTNIKQAHLDYHQTIEDYYKSKFNITKNQTKLDYLVLNLDDETSQHLFKNSDAQKITFSINNHNAICHFKGSKVYYGDVAVMKVKNKTMLFKYNLLAAICVAKLLDIENKYIKRAIKKFKNVKYRLEEVKPNIFNDAKSTNIYSTTSALKCFENDMVLLICGGFDRKEELNIIDAEFYNVKAIYVYGQTKDKINNLFKKKSIDIFVFDSLKEATLKALNDRVDEVILYSPMFASYDQYHSFEARGKEFNYIVNNYYQKS